MRTYRLATIMLAIGFLTGCTRSAGLEDIAPRPSTEVTNSIARPDAPASAAVAVETGGKIVAADAGFSAPVAQVALLAPDKPSPAVKALMDGTIHAQRFRDAKPINFGKASPRDLAVHGVDVSRWQGDIEWPKLRTQGANFVWIKATDGGDHLDPMFRTNWNAAALAGVPRGAYHFFYWCRTASSQADWFIRNVPKTRGALPPVLDVEWNHMSECKKRPSRENVLEKMQVFMDRLEKHYGQRPIIYTAPDFYRDNLKGAFPNHAFWLRSVAAHPSKVYPGREWVFWQYSGSGLSHGVDERIDLNVFGGTESQWRKWLAVNAG